MARKAISAILALLCIGFTWLLTSTYFDIRKYRSDPDGLSISALCQLYPLPILLITNLTRNDNYEYLLAEHSILCSGDHAKAVKIHRALAKRDYSLSMYRLSGYLSRTPGASVEENESQMWFNKALAKGEPRAIQSVKDKALAEEARKFQRIP